MPSPATPSDPLPRLLDLSHQLGREERRLAILGEGNTSTRVSADTFMVKASGSNLATLSSFGVTKCRFSDLVHLFDRKALRDVAIVGAIFASRVEHHATQL